MNPLSDARRGNPVTGNNHKRRRNHTTHNNDKDSKEEDDIITTTTPSNNTTSNTTRNIDLNEQKRIQTAQDIWYRKSNLGYYCFIEYYVHQEQLWYRTAPEDTTITNAGNTTTDSTTHIEVATDSTDSTDPTTQICQTSPSATTTTTTTQSRGYSRASKRRRKKLGVPVTPLDHTPTTTNITSTTDYSNNTHTSISNMNKNSHMEQKIPVHPLLHAFQSLVASSSSILRNIQQSNHTQMMTMIESFITSLSHPLPLTFRFRKIVTNQKQEQQEQLQKELIQHIQLHNTNQSTLSDSSTDLRIHPMFQNEHNTNTSNGLNQVEYYQCSAKVKSCTAPSPIPSNSESESKSKSWNDILIQYSQNGCIARQELGSMLPVLALYYTGYFHIKPFKHHHQQQQSSSSFTFLDMCSSPGSKLLQALEIITSLHQSNHNHNIVCIANDVLASRLQSLKDAVQRSGISTNITKNITYTCQDATKFTLRHIISKNTNNNNKTNSNDTNDTNKTTKLKTITSEQMKFNVILCDVPCSGDGTCRKDKHILPMFKPNIGNALHCIQYKILYHAMELLHTHGCICYSTCTLNPIENEAVVAAAIIQYNSRFNKNSLHNDKINNKKQQQHRNNNDDHLYEQQNTNTFVELIDCPKFNNVQLQNGITNWKVAEYQHDIDIHSSVSKLNNNYNNNNNNNNDVTHSDDQYLQWYDSYEDAVRRFGDGSTATTTSTTVLTTTLWPPSTNEHADLVQSLTKCKRLWPSDQDSGGFFLALIRKCQK